MKLFYTMGGGIGHVYRVFVFINQFKIKDFRILTSNHLAYKLFEPATILFLSPDTYPFEVDHFFKKIFPKLLVSDFYVDTFPFGLLGELSYKECEKIKIHYLARRLVWENYKQFSKEDFKFSTVYQFEPLEKEHRRFIENQSNELFQINLNYPLPDITRIPVDKLPKQKPIWLIVHTFKKEEVETLLYYAQEAAIFQNISPFFVVLSDQEVEVKNGICIAYFPAADWFLFADHIFAGAGFNIAQQIRPFLAKATLIPFPRLYDDQIWRAANIGKLA